MTDEHVMVRVTGRQFRHDGEEYHTGDTLEVPERAIEGWEGRLERVDNEAEAESSTDDGSSGNADEAEASGSDDDDTAESGDELDPHPGDLTVAELEARLGDVDDPELLHAIRDAEEAVDDRTGALDAIDDRISDLTEE